MDSTEKWIIVWLAINSFFILLHYVINAKRHKRVIDLLGEIFRSTDHNGRLLRGSKPKKS